MNTESKTNEQLTAEVAEVKEQIRILYNMHSLISVGPDVSDEELQENIAELRKEYTKVTGKTVFLN